MKKILSIALTIFLLCGLCAAFCMTATASLQKNGLSFNSDGYWETEQALEISSGGFTAEAWIYFPENQSKNSRGGVIIGNYGVNGNKFSVEVFSNGNPRVYFINSSGVMSDYKFDSVNLYNGKWTHLAISSDGKELKCYINGEMKQKLKLNLSEKIVINSLLVVGGDFRINNAQYFKGNIKSVALWNDVRTDKEISADKDAVSGNNLLAHYNFEKISTSTKTVNNSVKDGVALKYVPIWFNEKEPVTNYDYSFAVIGDTQTVCYYTPDKFGMIYDYILDNVEKKKIKFVFGLGDITEKSSAPEWEVATKNIRRMNGVVPYMLNRGNHDYPSNFTANCPVNQYGFDVDGTFDESPMNTYRVFKAGNVDYLFLTLDYGPSDDVLNWAGDIIAKHPNHNVIITTHAYLHHDGTTLEESDAATGGWIPTNDGGHNNGDDIWDKLVSKHENIVLVLSGHIDSDNVVVTHTKGEKGNTVTQMLVNPQTTDRVLGACGMVAMLYFSNGGRHVTVEYYSAIRDKYFLTTNQFEIDLAVVGVSKDAGFSNSKENNSQSGNNSSAENNSTQESKPSKDNNSSANNSVSVNNSSSQAGNSSADGTSSTLSSPSTENIITNGNGSFVDNNSSIEENVSYNDFTDNSVNDNNENDVKKPVLKDLETKKTNIPALIFSIVFALLVIVFTVVLFIKSAKNKKSKY